jgi:hypothetical protein
MQAITVRPRGKDKESFDQARRLLFRRIRCRPFAEVNKGTKTMKIHLDNIAPDPKQPRKEFDAAELETLAASIARNKLSDANERAHDLLELMERAAFRHHGGIHHAAWRAESVSWNWKARASPSAFQRSPSPCRTFFLTHERERTIFTRIVEDYQHSRIVDDSEAGLLSSSPRPPTMDR